MNYPQFQEFALESVSKQTVQPPLLRDRLRYCAALFMILSVNRFRRVSKPPAASVQQPPKKVTGPSGVTGHSGTSVIPPIASSLSLPLRTSTGVPDAKVFPEVVTRPIYGTDPFRHYQ